MAESNDGPRWHVIVGVIGLVYGVAGTLMWGLAALATVFTDQLFALGGMKIQMPMVLWASNLASSIILMGTGILLTVGSAMLIGRRVRGAALMRAWVVLRLAMLVIGLLLGFVLFTPNVDFQMASQEAQRQMAREHGATDADLGPAKTRESTEAMFRYMLGGMTVIFAAFPLFVGLLLTNAKKKEDIESWRTLLR